MNKEVYTVEIISHKNTGLLVAISNELPGLYVHGRDEEELNSRIPVAIRSILEAQGERDFELVRVEDNGPSPAFRNAVVHYERELVAA